MSPHADKSFRLTCGRRAVCARVTLAADEFRSVRGVTVLQAGGAQDAAAHYPPLLGVQGQVELADPAAHVLHGRHGAVQRRLSQQDARLAGDPCRRRGRRRRLLRRHSHQLSHDVRRTGRRGHLRPTRDPSQLPQQDHATWRRL